MKNLPFCEKVWYGDHDHSGHQGHHNHRRHLAARRRRHLHAIDKFLNWLTPEQKNELAVSSAVLVSFSGSSEAAAHLCFSWLS